MNICESLISQRIFVGRMEVKYGIKNYKNYQKREYITEASFFGN